MPINPSDTSFSLIAETVAGTTPATPAFLRFDFIEGDELNLESDKIESAVMRSNRTSAGFRKSNFRVGGSMKTELFRDTAVDLLLESALSGTFTTNVLKAGVTDKSFTVEKRMLNGASTLFRRFTGNQVSKISLTADMGSQVEMSVDVIGMNATTATAQIAGATYVNSANTMKLAGLDAAVTIAGLTVDYSSFEVSVEHDRESQGKLGSTTSRGIGTSGIRKVTGKVVFYREDWTPETVMTSDTPAALTIVIGTGANGYSISIPAAQWELPTDSTDASKVLVEASFVGRFDSVTGTDIQITKLA